MMSGSSDIETLALHGRHRDREAPPAYAELHVTSNFSFLEGASHPQELVAHAKALRLSAVAITDRNTLAGVVRAHVAAKQVGIQLIVGARLDFADSLPSILCLPTDRVAYGRLSRLLSKGQMRSKKGKCHLVLDDLAEASIGQILIVLPPANVPLTIIGFSDCQFERQLSRLKTEIKAPLYLAISCLYHGDDRARMAALERIGHRHGLCLVATGNILYHSPYRRPLQDVVTCIRNGFTLREAGYRLEANAERHLKSPLQMCRLMKGYEGALARTIDIAKVCRFTLDELVYEYPEEPIPKGTTAQSHLEALVDAGAKWRFPDGIPDKVSDTIARELSLISALKYAPYFLTVHDIVNYAISHGILCQGRGSAANSVVCYCLGITAVNPVEVDLLFERFVAAERNEPPDIDVDFEHDRREEVIQYIYRRYGRDRAGLAATVISYRGRSAVREVGKAMGLSEDIVSTLAGQVWGTRSGGALPDQYVREAGLDPDNPLLAATLELADELIGFPRHLSQHVGGFVLTRGPLVEVVPVGNAAMDDRTFIEWDKDDIDALGLLKVDVLALGMLSCIRRAFALLETHYQRPMTLAAVPREDSVVYDMLCRADSIGVFQVESRAQMNMLPRLRPRTYYDLVIEVAIVRPGPIQGDMVHPYLRRRDGREEEYYPSPSPFHGDKDELKEILGKTKGVPLFQEQAMRIAMIAAKFNGEEVNELRRALATFRRRGTIGQLEDKMISAMVGRGYDPEFAARCFNQIKGFGEYGFPESHAASFAHLVYVSSWIKCHYPAAFCCALLNSQPMGFYAPAQLVRDAQEHGVEVREPDVNLSWWDSTLELGAVPDKPALRLGLRQIDGLAVRDADAIIDARANSLFADVRDLHRRGDVGRAAIERLATADAMRSMGLDRRHALWEARALSPVAPLPLFAYAGCDETGQEESVRLPQMGLSEHVVNDYQTLRLSLKAHPLSFLRKALETDKVVSCNSLKHMKNGQSVSVAGVVLVRQRPGSAKGVVFMTIEDETGIANTVVWPQTLESFRSVVMTSRLIVVKGRIQRHGNIIHVISKTLLDRSNLLQDLSPSSSKMPIPIASADEVVRPEPGLQGAKSNPTQIRHPRDVRVIPRSGNTMLPKSRDFH